MTNAIFVIIAGMVMAILAGPSRSGWGTLLWGGGLGYALFAVFQLRARVDGLEEELERLRRRRDVRSPAPQPAVTPPPAPPQRHDDIIDLVIPEDEAVGTKPETPRLHAETPPPRREREPVPRPTPTEEPTLPPWLVGIVSGENLLVKLGVVILFFGVAFLVKYAAQHGLFPLELRLASAGAGGCCLLAVGWRLRDRRPVYAQVVQGGGVGIIYLTVFAAMRLYHLIPTPAGFTLLAAVCALSGLLALLQDAPPLAVLGSAGGFLAPELAAIGSGYPAVLFGYYAVLNAGIAGIARFRAWQGLNRLGFVATFIVSAAWGARFYHPDYFAVVEPFLVLFFLGYTTIALLSGRHGHEGSQADLDPLLVFGTPIAAFFLQAGLVQRYEYGLAWSALGLGLFYLGLATALLRRARETMEPFCEAFLPLGTVFTTLAIPLAFDGRWTAAAWCVEGAGLVRAGVRQERRLARGFGYLLLIGAGIAFLSEAGLPTGNWPVLNGFYCGALLVSGSALVVAWLLRCHNERLATWETGVEVFLFAWGMAWWFGSGLREIDQHTASALLYGGQLAFVALSCGVCGLLRRRLAWQLLRWPALGLLPAMAAFALFLLVDGADHPAAQGCWLAWPLAFGVWYALLKADDDRPPQLPAIVHAAPLWLGSILAAWELHWQIARYLPGMETWALTVWGVVPALVALVIVRGGERLPWPFSRHYASCFGPGAGPLVVSAWLWAVGVNLTEAGNPWPLPYAPFANPLDAATILVLVTLAGWYGRMPSALPGLSADLPHREARAAFGATLFLWLNAVLLRTIHHWAGVAFTADALFRSLLVQAALSVFWGLTALALMTFATRRGLRSFWIAGAGLLGVVVGKLFLVDLAHHGTVERIVSFVVVGILLLVIGWFAPVPPRESEGGAA
jgi:uncharacterized membrane protein